MNGFKSICDNRIFRRLYARGKSFVGKTVVTYVGYNNQKDIFVGITCGKKVGNAVLRNKSRRLIREAFRLLCPEVREGTSIVFVARAKTPYVKSYEVMAEITEHLKKAGVFKNGE